MQHYLRAMTAGCMLALTGCVTAGFRVPATDSSVVLGSDQGAVEYLRGLTRTMDSMISEGEFAKAAFELPIIAAGVAVPTALALGEGKKLAIYGAGLAGAGTALSSYVTPRQRVTYVAQARDAVVCIERRFVHQLITANQAGLVTGNSFAAFAPDQAKLTTYAAIADQVSGARFIAISGSDEVVTKLKLRLSNLGAAPDYGKIVADLRKLYDQAETATADAKSKGLREDTAKDLAEYEARVAECVAKIQ